MLYLLREGEEEDEQNQLGQQDNQQNDEKLQIRKQNSYITIVRTEPHF